jgi:hypothetical protein
MMACHNGLGNNSLVNLGPSGTSGEQPQRHLKAFLHV